MAKNQSIAAEKEVPHQGGTVDKIRDLIFGSQMEDYDRRFAQLETRITNETNRLINEINSRMDKIEAALTTEIVSLTDQHKKESAARSEGDETLRGALETLNGGLSKAMEDGDRELSAECERLAKTIQSRTAELSSEMADMKHEIDKSVAASSNRLEDAKVSRDDLAGFFAELATRLNDSAASGANG